MRVRVVRKHPDYLRVYHLAPAMAIAAGGALALVAPFSKLARRTLVAGALAYGGALGAAALATDRRRAPRVAAAMLALHAGYGVGMVGEAPNLLRK